MVFHICLYFSCAKITKDLFSSSCVTENTHHQLQVEAQILVWCRWYTPSLFKAGALPYIEMAAERSESIGNWCFLHYSIFYYFTKSHTITRISRLLPQSCQKSAWCHYLNLSCETYFLKIRAQLFSEENVPRVCCSNCQAKQTLKDHITV